MTIYNPTNALYQQLNSNNKSQFNERWVTKIPTFSPAFSDFEHKNCIDWLITAEKSILKLPNQSKFHEKQFFSTAFFFKKHDWSSVIVQQK